MIEYGLEACSLQKCHSGILIIAAMSRVQNLIDESIGRALYILIVKIVHAKFVKFNFLFQKDFNDAFFSHFY